MLNEDLILFFAIFVFLIDIFFWVFIKKMNKYIIYNALLVNEGKITKSHLAISKGKIEKISHTDDIFRTETYDSYQKIDAQGKYLLPGMIDEHVHFRDPGLIHKGDMFTESRAALAGGVTSVIDMPNVVPQTTTNALLQERLSMAEKSMCCNYAFHLAATDTNWDEVCRIDKQNVAALKLFLGSSTGNMLIQDEQVLDKVFSIQGLPILVHAENENIIKKNTEIYHQRFGDTMPISKHCEVRSEEACYTTSATAVRRAKQRGTRLHVLHVSTAKELTLFSRENKNITAEVCPSYLFFDNTDYEQYGTSIKCNPSIKTAKDKLALQKALNDGLVLTVGSDHAPHTWAEKQHNYFQAPSGMPMVQHSLQILLELVCQNRLTMERLVDSFAHQPAKLFNISKRGFLKEGYFADMVLVDMSVSEKVTKDNIFYKCQWSPLEGMVLHSHICQTFLNGVLVYDEGKFADTKAAMALKFDR